MKNRGLTISDMSRLVEYDDTIGFSKTFKKEKIIPPKNYREKINLTI